MFTVTSNVTVTSPFAGTFTVIPSLKFCSVYCVVSLLTTTYVPSLYVVPSGVLSFTTAVPVAEPVFSTVIVYFSVSPTFAVSALTSLFVLITGVSTDGFSSSVGVPSSTVALFIIEPSTPSFTVTVNVTVTVFPAGTVTLIPLFNSSSEYFFPSWLLTVTPFSALNVVPSGLLSATFTSPSTIPLFVSLIVYVNVSPTFTEPLSAVFSDEITG